MKIFSFLRILPLFFLVSLLSCTERTYDEPSGYKVTLFLKGGVFADFTSDRVHGGILQPTAMKNVPNLIPSEPYLDIGQPFAVWNTEPYGRGEDYTGESVIDRDVTLYAIYGQYVYDKSTLREIECGNEYGVYVLMDDIETGEAWEPLCPDPTLPFMGKLVGKGFVISYETKSGTNAVNMMPDYAGLFVYTKNAFIHDMVIYAKSTGAVKAGGAAAEIRNSVIDKVRIYGTVKGGTAGGVAGEAYNSKIINSSFGHINYNTSDYIFPSELIPYAMAHRVASDVADAGGIAGGIHESRIVSSTVCGEISTDTGTAGGIAGSMEASEIENTLHCGRVSGAAAKIGGLAGRALNSRIITSYSDSVVSASKNNSAAGGISGESVNTPVENSVAVGIAVTGEKAGRIIGEGADAADGYARLDMLVNGTHVDNGGKDGTGIPLAALKNGESFFRDINWDFRLVWEIPEYYKYPRIEWESDTLSRFTEIASVRELMELTEAVIAPTDSSYDIMKSNLARGGWYVLTKDMDLAEAEWRSIGTDTEPFYGVFYGNGKKIMNISDSLFDYTEGLRVYDLDLVNANGKKDGILAGKIGRRGKLENIKVTGKGESRGGLAGNISGEVEISYSSFSGELLLNAGNSDGFSGGIAASMAGGILAYSSTAGIAGVRSGITTDTSMAAAVGGLVGSASNILASNNYSSMDVYATGGRSGSGGGLFGVLSYSTVADSYASGSVYAATRYYFVPNLLTPMAGGIIGYAEDSDIRSVAYLGNAVSTEHYDVRNAEGYAGNITGRNINTGFLKVYSNSAVVLTAERTAGEMGTPIDLESVTESFYTAELKLNFEDIWKMPISGICPVFKRQ